MKDLNTTEIPELLAPAGGAVQLKAAVQNGADAVYMGGPLFNARMKADNFTHDDIKQAIDYAHEHNVKVYVTLNTLIKDDELCRAFSYVNFLYEEGADAVILQDMGLARLIGKYLPDMTMHMSTQGTIYNRQAVETVRKMGFSRIVPARELSLNEIEEITDECHREFNRCEVEVFVHGALCMCYSGQCQMSRLVGGANGRSGNRGLCAQPCRLAYKNEKGKEGYILSPRDICTIADIPALCRAGVDSFKIEGRLKSPQYVAVVTSIYRKYLDMYNETGAVNIDDEDSVALHQIFNRGGLSRGYLFGNPGRNLLSGKSPKNTGLYAGKVKSVKKGSSLIDIESSLDIRIGDGIEIYGRKVTGNVLSYVRPLSGNIIRIGDIKGTVNPGDRVYRVTEKALTEKAEKTYASDTAAHSRVNMEFTGRICQLPVLTAVDKTSDIRVSFSGAEKVEAANIKPISAERVRRQLAKLGGTPFEAGDVHVDIDDDAVISISSINDLRRKTIEALRAEKLKNCRKSLAKGRIFDICEHEQLGKLGLPYCSKGVHLYTEKEFDEFVKEAAEGRNADIASVYIPLELFMVKKEEKAIAELDKRYEVIPYILNISKGNLDRYIEDNFDYIVESVSGRGLAVGNPGWIKQFVDAGIKVYGDYGLNIYNEQALKAYEEIGVEVREYSHEMRTGEVKDVPLMITEHPIEALYLIDRKGIKYNILRSCSKDKYMIFKA